MNLKRFYTTRAIGAVAILVVIAVVGEAYYFVRPHNTNTVVAQPQPK
jgi:hypothetical protein